MLMERDGLIEKHAKAAGIEVKTNWQKVAGPSVINDGLLSGNVHFGAVGAPSLITLWSRTKIQCRREGRGGDDVLSALFRHPQSGAEIAEGAFVEGQDRDPVGEDLDAGADAADGGGRPVRAAELPEVRRVHRLARRIRTP